MRLAILCVALAVASPQEPQQRLPLARLLVELGEREGFEVIFTGPEPRNVVVRPSADMPIREQVISLLQASGLNYSIGGTTKKLVRVIVSAQGQGGVSVSAAAAPPVTVAPPPPAMAAPPPQPPGKGVQGKGEEGRSVNPDPDDPDDPLNDPGYKQVKHARQVDPDDPDEKDLDLSVKALPPQIDMNDPDEAAREKNRDPKAPVVKHPPQIDMNDPDEARRYPQLVKPSPAPPAPASASPEPKKQPQRR